MIKLYKQNISEELFELNYYDTTNECGDNCNNAAGCKCGDSSDNTGGLTCSDPATLGWF